MRTKYEGFDAQATDRGFALDGAGKTGEGLQTQLLQPLNCPKFENLRRSPDTLEEIPDDVRAYSSAIRSSALVPVHEHREIYMTPWLADLYRSLASIAKGRRIFGKYGIDEAAIKNFIKIVPCVHHAAMDEHRGVDCFIIFHDPETFLGQKFGAVGRDHKQEPLREAVYWDSAKDTVVNIDVTANLGTKFGHAAHTGHTPRADIFVDKAGSATNHYLRQAVPNFPDQVEGKQHIRNAQARMHILAQRILDVFEAKSGRLNGQRLDHIYTPEREAARRVEALRTERRGAHVSAMGRKEREKEKKAQRQAQSQEAKSRKSGNASLD